MHTRAARRITTAVLVAVLVVTTWSLQSGVAAPGMTAAASRLAAQNVDWMSAEDAQRLDIDIQVLVPSWIPAPFGGTPAIQASGGYYSLYWMNGGGAPTFLQITGEAGGSLPAGSPADLNNQLHINASVQGYDAIHDVTSIYDNVWWIAGGVLYTVSSNNMTGSDSLSLANSLVTLEPPVAEEPVDEPTPPPVDEEEPEPSPTGSIDGPGSVASGDVVTLEVYPSEVGTLRTTDGYFTGSGATFITDLTGGGVEWQAPSVSSETTVEFTLLDAQTGVVTDWTSLVVYPVDEPTEPEQSEPDPVVEDVSEPDESETESVDQAEEPVVEETPLPEPTSVAGSAGVADGSGGGTVPTTVEAPANTQSPASGGLLSDGTAGPEIPRGADGTGGIWQVIIP